MHEQDYKAFNSGKTELNGHKEHDKGYSGEKDYKKWEFKNK